MSALALASAVARAGRRWRDYRAAARVPRIVHRRRYGPFTVVAVRYAWVAQIGTSRRMRYGWSVVSTETDKQRVGVTIHAGRTTVVVLRIPVERTTGEGVTRSGV